ncbi:hypothetical protein PC116_g30070 [Phytophthora cactorum]|nr:hypothetical protein PC116_g30070 [Phytophthora cactorum]
MRLISLAASPAFFAAIKAVRPSASAMFGSALCFNSCSTMRIFCES